MDKLIINTDGGSRGNPGPAASAFLVKDQKGIVIHEESKFLGVATNNFAEYNAVILALEFLSSYLIPNTQYVIQFFLDSELVVKQLNGLYKIKSPDIVPLALKVKDLQRNLNLTTSFTHVRRLENSEADKLVNVCLNENS